MTYFITSPLTINENSVFKKPSIKCTTRIIEKSNVFITRTFVVFKVSVIFSCFLNVLEKYNAVTCVLLTRMGNGYTNQYVVNYCDTNQFISRY